MVSKLNTEVGYVPIITEEVRQARAFGNKLHIYLSYDFTIKGRSQKSTIIQNIVQVLNIFQGLHPFIVKSGMQLIPKAHSKAHACRADLL